MKLLLLPTYCYPEHAASDHLSKNRNDAFAAAGFKSIAYVPTPTRGVSDEVRSEYKKKKVEYMYDGHLEIHRFAMFREGRNPMGRALRYSLCWIKQFNRGLLAKDIDVIFLVSTPPIQGMLGGILSRLKKVPFVYNLQDIFPDSLVGTGLAKKGGLLWKIGRVIEDFTYRNADKIIVISEDFKRNIMAKGVPEEKIEVIYNWADEQAVHPVADEANELIRELGFVKDRFTVVYAGNLGHAQNVDIIIDAAEILKNIQFVIFGSGGKEVELRAKVAEKSLENVKMFPLQPYERVSEVYSLGDACVVSCKPGLGGSAMPSKTWSIMSCGRPVVANFDEGDLKNILESNECGAFSRAGDTEAFVATIKCMAEDLEECKRMGANARKFILENLTKEVGTQKYVDVIKSVVKSKEK